MSKSNKKTSSSTPIKGLASLALVDSSLNSAANQEINLEYLFKRVPQILSNLRFGVFIDVPQLLNQPEKFGAQALTLFEEALYRSVACHELKILEEILKPSSLLNDLLQKSPHKYLKVWLKAFKKNTPEVLSILYESPFKATFDANAQALLENAYAQTQENIFQQYDSQNWVILEYLLTKTTAISSPYVEKLAHSIKNAETTIKRRTRRSFYEEAAEFYDKMAVWIEREKIAQQFKALDSLEVEAPGHTKKKTQKI